MNKKSGTKGSLISPTAPKDALEADKADPGEVEAIKAKQRETKEGKYGQESLKPFKPPETAEDKEKKTSWIEIKLVDEEENPVPGERYQIILPDGQTAAEGTLDGDGFARVEGFDPGSCQVTFPDLDKDAWQDK